MGRAGLLPLQADRRAPHGALIYQRKDTMRKLISPGRLVFLTLVLAGILTLYIATLYQLQIVDGTKYYNESINSIVSHEAVIAARGNVLDRYGRMLVSNRTCNNLLIDADELFEQEDPNAVILRMCRIVEENGDSYNDDLPISTSTPWEFKDMSAWESTLMQAWLQANGLDSSASAVEVMAMMRSRYGIDGNYTAEEMRIIAGVRYSVNVRYVIATSDYTYAQDVSINTITALMEADVPGVEVQVSYIREYNTTYGAQILGYTGSIQGEGQMAYYCDELGYPLNAVVGQEGVERAFEELLHGVDGEAEITRTSEGVVTSTVYTTLPQPGANIYLTLDIELQGVAESTLANYIESTNAQRVEDNAMYKARGEADKIEELITGGAIVAVDVHTGEPLCIASYPTYSLETFWDDYADLLEDESNPLVNRALTGLYSPGSTFKPCMALAALTENLLSGDEQIVCTGIYRDYESQGYAPTCTGTHGALTVSEALTYSCNIFFFTLGDTKLGINRIDEYAALLGLGEYTGIELQEAKGRVASPDIKAALYDDPWDQGWYAADTLLASIGQSVTGVTPIQLARYVAAIANSGTTYSCSILKSASSYDYSDSIFNRTPEAVSQIETTETVWDLIHEGMRGVVTTGTAKNEFYGFPYTVAAKTGTTQTGTGTNSGFFICYAPYENPEIAVAVAMENGVAGANLATMARDVLEYYFNFEQSTQQTENELTLLP